jgi:hypothetical protein
LVRCLWELTYVVQWIGRNFQTQCHAQGFSWIFQTVGVKGFERWDHKGIHDKRDCRDSSLFSTKGMNHRTHHITPRTQAMTRISYRRSDCWGLSTIKRCIAGWHTNLMGG